MTPRALLLALWLGLAGAACAQESAPDYAEWDALASGAEDALEAGEMDDDALEALRAQIAQRREGFLAAQDANAARIATLEDQIEALGPVPEDGEEPPDIAARRAELEERLALLRQPGRTAEEAFFRASGLVAEIDRTLRDRQARALMEVGPSPLNPALWPPAAAALRETGRALAAEWRETRRDAAEGHGMGRRWPVVLGLVLAGVALIVRARGWMKPLMRRAEAHLPPRAQGAAVFALSAGQIVLPVVGAVLIATALDVSGAMGPVGGAMGAGLVLASLQYFGARWIGSWLFPVGERWNLTLGLPSDARAEGRAYTGLLGAALALGVLLSLLADALGWSDATRAVIAFPLQAGIGLMLFRLGQLLSRHAGRPARSQDEPGAAAEPASATAADGYAGPLLRNVGRASMAVGVAGPALAAVGYVRLSQQLLIPTVTSLALIGLLVILQQLIRDLYALAARRDDGARDALLPVLLGFGLALCSLPLFALLWGARPSDITEVWARIRAGFRVGDTVVSPGAILSFLLILAIGVALTRLVQGALRAQVLPRTRIDPGGRTAIVSGVGYVGFILAALVAVTGAGIDLSALAIVAGALSVGIGFGLQNVVNNFVSGHHPADRAPDLGGRLDPGRRPDGLRPLDLGALDPDRDLRPHRRHRAQRRPHLGHGDELDPRQPHWAADPARGGGLRHRHAPRGADPARDRRGPPDGASEAAALDPVPPLRRRRAGVRGPGHPARRQLGAVGRERPQPRDRPPLLRGGDRDPPSPSATSGCATPRPWAGGTPPPPRGRRSGPRAAPRSSSRGSAAAKTRRGVRGGAASAPLDPARARPARRSHAGGGDLGASSRAGGLGARSGGRGWQAARPEACP